MYVHLISDCEWSSKIWTKKDELANTEYFMLLNITKWNATRCDAIRWDAVYDLLLSRLPCNYRATVLFDFTLLAEKFNRNEKAQRANSFAVKVKCLIVEEYGIKHNNDSAEMWRMKMFAGVPFATPVYKISVICLFSYPRIYFNKAEWKWLMVCIWQFSWALFHNVLVFYFCFVVCNHFGLQLTFQKKKRNRMKKVDFRFLMWVWTKTICAAVELTSAELQATFDVVLQSEMFVMSAQTLNNILAAQTVEKVLQQYNYISTEQIAHSQRRIHQRNRSGRVDVAHSCWWCSLFPLCLNFNFNLPPQSLGSQWKQL